MSKSKIAYLHFFSVALLASTIMHGLNSSRIKSAAAIIINADTNNNSRSQVVLSKSDLDRFSRLQTASVLANNFLVQNVDISSNITNGDEETSRRLRLISLAFFLLFFVPLGIFYPLFLFYKMLLIKPDESKNINGVNDILAQDEVDRSPPTEPAKITPAIKKELDRATVSKLQISFSPPASELRAELSKVGFDGGINTGYGLVNLMHQTVAVLIEQGYWTHVSCDSVTLPVGKVKSEFDFISQQERKKIAQQQTHPTNYNRHVTDIEGYERDYSYVVVTLILCTSHKIPLFQTINTKKQLLEELIQLGKIEKDTVIKFELLWNPQQRKEYISNDQLLTEYGDMTRLL